MKSQNIRPTLLTIIVMASFATAIAAPILKTNKNSVPHASWETPISMFGDDAFKAKRNQEAREFDAAISDLEKILRLDLDTKEGSAEATKILERNTKKLQFADAKIASGALKSARFKKGVEEEAKKRGGNQKFAEELKRGSVVTKNIEGIEEAVRDAEASIAPALAVLKKLSDKFESAARKQNAVFLNTGYESISDLRSLAERACGDSTAIGPVAQNSCQQLGFNVTRSVCNVILGVILVYLGFVEDMACATGCVARAATAWTTCTGRASLQPFPLNLAAASACSLTLTNVTRNCLVNC